MKREIKEENLIALIPDSFTSLKLQNLRGDIFYKTGNSSFRLAIPMVPLGSIFQYSEKLIDKSKGLLKTIYKEISPPYILEIQYPIKINDVILLKTKMSVEIIAILNRLKDRLKESDILNDKCTLSPPSKGLFLGYIKNESDFEFTKKIFKSKHSIAGNKIYKASLILFNLYHNEKYGEKSYNWNYTNIINIKSSGNITK